MKMPKATEEQKQAFRDLVEPLAADSAAIAVRPMFGQLGGFVNGNMFVGLFAPQVGVKLDESDQAELITLGGGPFGPEERPMGGWLTLPEDLDQAAASAWVARAAAYVATFPPKATKK